MSIKKYEYLDHTADVQFHSWGDSLKEAFEQVVSCMFNYMTDLDKADIDPACHVEINVAGHDLESLLFNFMDEALFIFSTEFILIKRVEIKQFDLINFSITAIGFGEQWNLQKHSQGTEIKAITYSNMQIRNEPDDHSIYVIVDI